LEYHRSIASISTVGVSAMINEDGTIISQLEPYRTGSLTAKLPLYDQVTPAHRNGLAAEYGSFLLACWAVLGALRRLWVNRR
jgi:apolipoprotein N-acyltransferase